MTCSIIIERENPMIGGVRFNVHTLQYQKEWKITI